MGVNSIVPKGRERLEGCLRVSNDFAETERLSAAKVLLLLNQADTGLFGRCTLLVRRASPWQDGHPAIAKAKIFTFPPTCNGSTSQFGSSRRLESQVLVPASC